MIDQFRCRWRIINQADALANAPDVFPRFRGWIAAWTEIHFGFIRDRQIIGIESCITSNLQTSTVADIAQHPLKTFLEHGILATINSDDPAVEGIDIQHEYLHAAAQAGLSEAQIRQAQQNGLSIAFLSAQEKQQLQEKVSQRNAFPGIN